MKRLLIYSMLLTVMIFTSCQQQNPSWLQQQDKEKNQGTLSLNCFTSLGYNTKAEPTQYVYAIEIRKADNNEVAYTIDDHTKITADGIKLQAGNYKVTATSGSLESKASYTPCYSGSQDFTIEAGKMTNLTITTSLADVKVTANIDQTVSEFLGDYDLVITNNESGSLEFKPGNMIGYFRNTGTIKWAITVNYTDGSSRVIDGIFENTQPRDHYTVNFKLGAPQANEDLNISHTIETINDSYDITISGNAQKPVAYKIESTNPWAKFAEVEASWGTEAKPDDLVFEYRVDGASTWSTAEGTESENLFKSKIKGLSANTKYFIRAATASAKGSPVEFTTEDTPVLENMGFETWTQKGKNWYANGSAEDVYWGTGNEGVSGFFAGSKPSNTAPTDDAHSGSKAARLESIKVNVVNFAAGNLFLGSFSTNITKPLDSPSFGRPFTGRPTQLSFWYKYLPNTWNDPAEADKCTAYILLGTWGGEIKSSQIKGLDTEGCIAYGSFVSDARVETYTKQTIDIQYKDTKTKPTRAIVVFSSSLRGEEYKGALGSVMFIDDLEFGWE